VKPDKLVRVVSLREEFEYLLRNDATVPDWSEQEMALILGRLDRAVQNVCHNRYHGRVPPEPNILER
jgi:hypothetical protein